MQKNTQTKATPPILSNGLVRRLAAWMLHRPRSSDLFFCNLRDTARAIYRATRQKPNASNSATGDRGASPAKADGKP